MDEEIRKKGEEFAEFIAGLSKEQIRQANEAEYLRAKEEHERFKKAYDLGECYLCKRSLDSFVVEQPCVHWLLKPEGFKKKHIELIAEKYGYFQIQGLLRWYANEDAFAKNINNLPEEGTDSKIIELTIKYQNLEWSFSCGETDYQGHGGSKNATHPHYHFQMRVDKRPLIRFNDFHLPLHKADLINMEATKRGQLSEANSFGSGMNEILESGLTHENLGPAVAPEDENEAPLKIDSMIQANAGTLIQGEDVYQLIMEAKEKGVTVASLLHKLPNASGEIIVSPGPGVVQQAPRSRGKKKP